MKSSDDWYKEMLFWGRKHSRAVIRAEYALDRDDEAGLKIAQQQMDLYQRRMNAAIPESIHREIDAEELLERKEAFLE